MPLPSSGDTPFPPPPLLKVLYLRQFKHLASLNLSGNPFCSPSSTAGHVYPLYPVATLPQLVYMDFKFISPEAVSCDPWGCWWTFTS